MRDGCAVLHRMKRMAGVLVQNVTFRRFPARSILFFRSLGLQLTWSIQSSSEVEEVEYDQSAKTFAPWLCKRQRRRANGSSTFLLRSMIPFFHNLTQKRSIMVVTFVPF